MDNSFKKARIVSMAGSKPVSLGSTQKYLVQRVDILSTICVALVMEESPHNRARLMGMVAMIQNLDVDDESREEPDRG